MATAEIISPGVRGERGNGHSFKKSWLRMLAEKSRNQISRGHAIDAHRTDGHMRWPRWIAWTRKRMNNFKDHAQPEAEIRKCGCR